MRSWDLTVARGRRTLAAADGNLARALRLRRQPWDAGPLDYHSRPVDPSVVEAAVAVAAVRAGELAEAAVEEHHQHLGGLQHYRGRRRLSEAVWRALRPPLGERYQ